MRRQNIITVITPVYNTQHNYFKEYFDSTIKAVEYFNNEYFNKFNAEYDKVNILIYNDGSDNEETLSVLTEYKNKYSDIITIINGEINKGYATSINILLDNCNCKYVCYMDSDDTMEFNRLTVQYDYMEEHSNITLCTSNTTNVVGWYNGIVRILELYNNQNITNDVNTLLPQNCICHPTIFYKLSDINKHNIRYNINYIVCNDYYFYFDVLKNNLYIGFIPDKLVFYRIKNNDNQLIRRENKKCGEEITKIKTLIKNYITNSDK